MHLACFRGCQGHETAVSVSPVQELLEAEAANVKPIEDEIDEERRKVDAKTPITEQVIPVCLHTLFL
jgi:hypothetical protein